MSLFDALGVLLALYVAYAGVRGRVVATSGPGARLIRRAERPRYFWTVIAIYAGLSLALVLVF